MVISDFAVWLGRGFLDCELVHGKLCAASINFSSDTKVVDGDFAWFGWVVSVVAGFDRLLAIG